MKRNIIFATILILFSQKTEADYMKYSFASENSARIEAAISNNFFSADLCWELERLIPIEIAFNFGELKFGKPEYSGKIKYLFSERSKFDEEYFKISSIIAKRAVASDCALIFNSKNMLCLSGQSSNSKIYLIEQNMGFLNIGFSVIDIPARESDDYYFNYCPYSQTVYRPYIGCDIKNDIFAFGALGSGDLSSGMPLKIQISSAVRITLPFCKLISGLKYSAPGMRGLDGSVPDGGWLFSLEGEFCQDKDFCVSLALETNIPKKTHYFDANSNTSIHAKIAATEKNNKLDWQAYIKTADSFLYWRDIEYWVDFTTIHYLGELELFWQFRYMENAKKIEIKTKHGAAIKVGPFELSAFAILPDEYVFECKINFPLCGISAKYGMEKNKTRFEFSIKSEE